MLTTGLADPNGSSALVAAVSWIQAAMLGTLATTIATIAVATVGILVMSGRMQLRRGVTVILGCFILFGAPTIAAGLVQLSSKDGGSRAEAAVSAIDVSPPPLAAPTPKPQVYDPYAGASVPQR